MNALCHQEGQLVGVLTRGGDADHALRKKKDQWKGRGYLVLRGDFLSLRFFTYLLHVRWNMRVNNNKTQPTERTLALWAWELTAQDGVEGPSGFTALGAIPLRANLHPLRLCVPRGSEQILALDFESRSPPHTQEHRQSQAPYCPPRHRRWL